MGGVILAYLLYNLFFFLKSYQDVQGPAPLGVGFHGILPNHILLYQQP